MGVKDLGKVAKKYCSDYQFTLPLTNFSGTPWAIDTLNQLFRNYSFSIKEVLKHQKDIFKSPDENQLRQKLRKKVFDFNKKLCDHNITPVWVWDGEAQATKVQTQEERREKRREAVKKREAFRKELQEKDILEITEDEERKWINMVSTTTDFPKGELDMLKRIMSEMGVPNITSVDEAENLCSSLCVEGKVSLVWSNDTDNYPLGACKVASEFFYKKGKVYVKGVEPAKIVRDLKMNFKVFRDFCILLGNDFNNRLYRVGMVKSLKLIREHGDLETIDRKTHHNLTFMKYPFVRKQLTPYSTYYQPSVHFKVNKCDNPDLIEKLENEHPRMEIQTYISLISDLRLKDTEYSDDEEGIDSD
jgi:5'-3' exonuclease